MPVPPFGSGAGRDAFDLDVPQIAPDPATACDPTLTQTPHTAMTVALMDGSVQSIGGDIDFLAWRAYVHPHDEGAPPVK